MLVIAVLGVMLVGCVPPGFTDTLVANVAEPTALASAPDGRLFVTSHPGLVRIIKAGALLETPALDITAVTCSNWDNGLNGIALDPSFPTNPWVYLYSTRNEAGTCLNRVSRYTIAGDVIDPASEVVLARGITSQGTFHNAGDLAFGHDGMLYVSVGDGGCDYATPTNCAGDNDAARDRHVPLGKILRITPTGGVPPDNPFASNRDRCAPDGVTKVGKFCPETFAWGLRNPFRMAFDPNAPGVRFFINDVGQNTWEEINEGKAGADYGWNVREGHCALGSTTSCSPTNPPPSGMTDPIFDYGRTEGCGSITGGAFVPDGVWPSEYDGDYLFCDYVCGRIFRLEPDGSGGYTRTDFAAELGESSAVHMHFAGSTLYYTTYANGGEVHAITPPATNGAPTASVTATPTSGDAPLTVELDGSASTDPENEALTYEWQWGDGTPGATTSEPTTSHVYESFGTYTASLVVRDPSGATSPAPATVVIDVSTAGNRPPTLAITAPPGDARFAVGEPITAVASASDPDGDPVTLSWQVNRRHGHGLPTSHTHPLASGTGSSITFTYPAPEDLAAATNSFVEATVTAVDGRGGTATTTQRLEPNLVAITLASDPTGSQVRLNGQAATAPATYTSWEGWVVTLSAEAPNQYQFGSWSDGGAATHVVTTPATAVTYTVTFVRNGKR